MQELIDDGVANGATLALRGQIDGTVAGASVLDRVTPAMRIYCEESFAPVVSVIRVFDDAQAVRVANDSEYGLSSSIFSRDVDRALGLARQIEAGMVHINGPTVHDEAQMPFGGVKASGWGRFGGRAGIDAFTELRWVTMQAADRHYPF